MVRLILGVGQTKKMTPKFILLLCEDIKPEWFYPKYILETAPNNTSNIKNIWKNTDGDWNRISHDFDDNCLDIIGATKIKFYTDDKSLSLFLIDKTKKYAINKTISLKSVNLQRPSPTNNE